MIGVSICAALLPTVLVSISTFGLPTVSPDAVVALASPLSSSPPSPVAVSSLAALSLPPEPPDAAPPDELSPEPEDDPESEEEELDEAGGGGGGGGGGGELTEPPATRVPVSDAWMLEVTLVASC